MVFATLVTVNADTLTRGVPAKKKCVDRHNNALDEGNALKMKSVENPPMFAFVMMDGLVPIVTSKMMSVHTLALDMDFVRKGFARATGDGQAIIARPSLAQTRAPNMDCVSKTVITVVIATALPRGTQSHANWRLVQMTALAKECAIEQLEYVFAMTPTQESRANYVCAPTIARILMVSAT